MHCRVPVFFPGRDERGNSIEGKRGTDGCQKESGEGEITVSFASDFKTNILLLACPIGNIYQIGQI